MDPTLASLWGSVFQNQTAPAGPQPYPTFSNPGGFGSQQGFNGIPQPGAMPPGMSPNVAMNKAQPGQGPSPDPSSRSFNPWSLQGEALARG